MRVRILMQHKEAFFMQLRILHLWEAELIFRGNCWDKSVNEEQKKIISQNVKHLCSTMKGVHKPSGELNVKAAAEEMGVGQTTLMRILKGESKQLRPQTEAALQTYFNLSKDDLYNPDLPTLKRESKVDRLHRMFQELSPEEQLEFVARNPRARIVFE